MSGIELTAYSGAILGPIAKFLGWIMNAIYMLMYNVFGIENIGLSILLLTIFIYSCMLPLTVKQQKYSKLSQKMQPEILAVQNKYKNKKDQASLMAMNQEQQMIYDKYGVSPMGSCLQMLIQMPIFFALYRVFYNIPAYIVNVKEHFMGLVEEIKQTEGFVDKLTQMMADYKLNATLRVDLSTTGDTLNNYIVDILYKIPSAGWEKMEDYFPNLADAIDEMVVHINQFNYIFSFGDFQGLNISDTPWNIIKDNFAVQGYLMMFLAVMVPVVSYLTQVLNLKLMPQPTGGNDQMAQQMKTMNTMMPLFSLFLCFTVQVGLGIYWIFSSVSRGVQQVCINQYFKNLDLDAVIEKNQEKAKKRREKMGISENQIRNAAQISTRTIETKANVKVDETKAVELERANNTKVNAKSGSLAAKANMVKEFNERNSRK